MIKTIAVALFGIAGATSALQGGGGCEETPTAGAWNTGAHPNFASSETTLGIEVGFSLMENLGQWPGGPTYVGSLRGMRVGVLPDAILLQLHEQAGDPSRGVVVKLAFEGASSVKLEGIDEKQGVNHFYQGNDSARWRTNVRSFSQVRFRGLYEGIDLLLREDEGELEYDLIVQPGADLSQVVVRCQGTESIRVHPEEGVTLDTAIGQLQHPVGRSWQVAASNSRKEVALRYRRIDGERFGFEVLERDPSLLLVIDPELLWSTYLGGSGGGASLGDEARAVALDGNGNVTVVGSSEGGLEGGEFPMTPGTFQAPGLPRFEDVFVTRFRQSDGELVYSCLIGGFGHSESALAVAVDSGGRATVVGQTHSGDFPTTLGAFDEFKNSIAATAFVFRLSGDGSELEYSTFLDGSAPSTARAVAVTDSGSAVVGGDTGADDFPTTPGAYSTIRVGGSEGFITRLNPTGSSLEWSTFLGGSFTENLYALAVDGQGVVTTTGATGSSDFPTTPGAFNTSTPVGGDAFVTRLDSDGSSLIWSTFLGGRKSEVGAAIALHASGDAIVGGSTLSDNFPTTIGVLQEAFALGAPSSGFVTRLNASGSSLVYSTFLGGASGPSVAGLVADATGVVTLSGFATMGFPTTPGAYQTIGQGIDIYVARMDPMGRRLLYSSFVGGLQEEAAFGLAMKDTGRITLVGYNLGAGFPTTPGAFRPNYTGGGREAVIVTLDLTLEGIRLFEKSQSACLGPLSMNATEMPAAGASSFGFYCSAAPPLAKGFLIVQHTGSPLGSAIGSERLIGFGARSISVTSDANGYVETPFPLPTRTDGLRFAARYVFHDTVACPAAGPWATSNSVLVTVQ